MIGWAELPLLPADFGPGDRHDRAFAAADRAELFSARDSESAFDDCYAALASEFAPRGEMETREDLRWELTGREPGVWVVRYELLGLRVGGDLAAVRDAYVLRRATDGLVVVVLAHALVLPPFRRSGLGAVLRAIPAGLGRRVSQGSPLLLMCETDPWRPDDPSGRARFDAYAAGGFGWLDPADVPYAQPDFSDWRSAGRRPDPVPLLVGVRHVGHEAAPRLALPLVRAVYDAMDELHRTFTPEDTDARRRCFEARAVRHPPALAVLRPGADDHRLSLAHLRASLPKRLGGDLA